MIDADRAFIEAAHAQPLSGCSSSQQPDALEQPVDFMIICMESVRLWAWRLARNPSITMMERPLLWFDPTRVISQAQ